MMVTSEETIKNLQNEVLRLKLIVFQQEKMLDQRGRPPGQDLDETKRDLIADLMNTNEELRKQIQELEAVTEQEKEPSEPERPQLMDAACQTNLDRLNIEQLIEASLELKRQKRQQLQQQEQLLKQRQEEIQKQRLQQHLQTMEQQQQQQHPTATTGMSTLHQQQPIYHNHYLQAPQQQMQQQQDWPQHLQLQKDYFPIPVKNQMSPDEKESLDKLFRLDGLLTTARDRLRAVALN